MLDVEGMESDAVLDEREWAREGTEEGGQEGVERRLECLILFVADETGGESRPSSTHKSAESRLLTRSVQTVSNPLTTSTNMEIASSPPTDPSGNIITGSSNTRPSLTAHEPSAPYMSRTERDQSTTSWLNVSRRTVSQDLSRVSHACNLGEMGRQVLNSGW